MIQCNVRAYGLSALCSMSWCVSASEILPAAAPRVPSNATDVAHNPEIPRDIVQVKRGNFLLPVSQQPSPLFSLGQNIVDKGDTLALLAVAPFGGPNRHSITLAPAFLYGISNKCSLLIAVPFSFLKDDCCKTRGLSDIGAQIEYAFYEYKQPTFTYQATCLAAMFLPTGSTRATPELGSGACGFEFGGTFSYYSPDWLWFTSAGGLISTKGKRLRASSTFLYQGGFGKNITTRPGWIFTWMLEFNGVYSTRQRVCSVTRRDSGSNIIYLTPSLWVSSERFILQAGITVLPVQHLFGCQTGIEIGGLINIGWKFNG